MADLIRYVNVDVVGGAGDGTTRANAFSSMNLLVSTVHNLIVDNNTLTAYHDASSDTADTTAVNFTGWNANDTYYFRALPDTGNEHNRVWSDTGYRLSVANSDVLIINDGGSFWEGLKFELSGTNANYQKCVFMNDADNGTTIYVSKCIMKAANNATYRERPFSLSVAAGRTAHAWDNIVWNVNASPSHVANSAVHNDSAGSTYVANCTFSGGYNSCFTSANFTEMYNSIFEGAANIVAGGFDTANFNSSDKGTTTGGGSDVTNATFSFTNKSVGNFIPLVTDTGARGNGTNLSAGTIGFNDDCGDNLWGAVWDCGACKFLTTPPPPGGGVPFPLLNGGLLTNERLLQ